MKQEITAAAHFLSSIFLQNSPSSQTQAFKQHLVSALETKFRDHWHETAPSLGQAFRCIRVCPDEPLDPVLTEACQVAGLPPNVFCVGLELTLWVDPREVMCRLGDLKCVYHTVAAGPHLSGASDPPEPEELEHLLEQAKELYQKKLDSFVGSGSTSVPSFPSCFPSSPHQRKPSAIRGAVVIQGTVNAQSCLYNGYNNGYHDDMHQQSQLPGSPSRSLQPPGSSPTPEQLQQQMLHPPPPPLFSDPPPPPPPFTNGSYNTSSSTVSSSSSNNLNGSNYNNSSNGSIYSSNSVNSSPSSKMSRARHRESQAIEIKS